MRKLKVMSIVGTRPEIIRLSRVFAELDQHCNHVLVHTGQNYDYELNQVFFDELRVRKPDWFLSSADGSRSAANTVGNIIIKVDEVLEQVQPDAILVLGDTNSCLSVIPAKRRKIPIFHMEAGNRCFDLRVPEETNRRIVDHVADINLTYSSIARDYLLREGLPADQVIKTGSPMFEVLNYYMPEIQASNILQILGLKCLQYFIVSLHREENVDNDKTFLKAVEILNFVAEEYGFPVILSTHPRTKKRIDLMNIRFHPGIKILKPLGFFDYVKLEMNSTAVLSDSGTINEESSILNFPALNLREAHERPEAMEEGSVMMVGLNLTRVRQGLEILKTQWIGETRSLRIVPDYNVPNVSAKVIRIIHSYTDYIKMVVWRQY
jgi:UDP-N-acetylglucosamine 2-epimerase